MSTDTTVKKQFKPLYDLLNTNRDKTVEEVLPSILELVAKAQGSRDSSVFHRNADGEVVAIKCYYHKLWMDPRIVDWGLKANTNTGYNNMCKDGVSKWTRRNNQLKALDASILDKVSSGEIEINKIEEVRTKLQAELNVIEPREDGYGFETLQECIEYSRNQGLTVD